MAKNGPIDPKFGHILHLWDFMNFKNFGKIGPFLGDFWPKKRVFYAKSAKI